MQVVARELGMRARRVAAAQNDAFKLTRGGSILWRDDEIAKLERADDPLQPGLTLLVDERTSEADREKVLARLKTWLDDTIADKLKPLAEMSRAGDLQGLARGIAFQLKENLGALKREAVADEINALDQPARAELRKYGLRFGAFNIFFPVMLKPAAADLAATLWLLKNGGTGNGVAPQLPRPGLTSAATDPATPEALYRAHGFHVCGPRAIRLDILERLADLIRPLLAWRSSPEKPGTPPKGSTGDGGFKLTDEMMSILGCSAEELGEVLKALGFRLERRPIAAKPVAPQEASAKLPSDTEAAVAPAESAELSGTTEAAAATGAPEAEPETVVAAESTASAPAGETPPEAAAAEPEKFEDIWRPRRHQRSEHRDAPRRDHGRDTRRRKPREPRAAPAAAVAEPGTATAAVAEARIDQPRPDRPQTHRQDRGDRPRSENRGSEGRGDRGPRKDDQNRPRREHDNRDKRQREGRRRDEPGRSPQMITAAPPKPATGDASSPFAALAALKAMMEKRSEGSGST
jgi:ATP-dependent RNA helicase SUPV3L1/SUV3